MSVFILIVLRFHGIEFDCDARVPFVRSEPVDRRRVRRRNFRVLAFDFSVPA